MFFHCKDQFMSLPTSEEIESLVDQRIKTFRQPDIRQRYSEGERKQMSIEAEILETTSICPVEQLKHLENTFFGVDTRKLKNISQKEFYNAKMMLAIMCLTDTVIHLSPAEGGAFTSHQRIRHWISHLRRIGKESAFGYAMVASFEEASDMFVIKAPRDDEANRDATHELFVGLFGTNRLREYVPNFAYVYGGFRCSPPLIDPETRDVVSWCGSSGKSYQYIIYENISPSISFGDYIRNATFDQFLEKYLQILYALRQAHKIIDFTHYDLHMHNVLLRKIPSFQGVFSIPYETERGTEYLLTDAIATIIDYGRAHIQYNDQHFGVWNVPVYFIYPDRSFPLYDAYKLLNWLLFKMMQTRNPTFDEASRLLLFFRPQEKPEDIVRKHSDSTYILPLTPEISQLSLDDFITFIRQNWATPFLRSQPGSEPLLSCQGERLCLTYEKIIEELGLHQVHPPRDLFDFCDMTVILSRRRQFKLLESVISQFPYQHHKDQALKKFGQLVFQISTRLSQIPRVDIVGLPSSILLSEAIINAHREYVLHVAKTLDLIEQLDLLVDSLSCSGQTVSDVDLESELPHLREIVEILYTSLVPELNKISEDIDAINHLSIRPDPDIWYWSGLQFFRYLMFS
jgi:hypothetical protein